MAFTLSLSLCVPGKVAIQKEDLQRYHNRDTWFQLQHVDADSEVQVRLTRAPGRVDVALSCVPETGEGGPSAPSLHLCDPAQARSSVVFVALVTGAFCQADGSNIKNTEGGEGGGKKKAKSEW